MLNGWSDDYRECDDIPATPAQTAEFFGYILAGCGAWVAFLYWLVTHWGQR